MTTLSNKVYTTGNEAAASKREITPEERVKMKNDLIGENSCNALDFQKRAIKRFGPPAGVFLRQLLFWEGASAASDGWMWKSRREMENETGLTQKQQAKARKILVAAGVLEEDVRPVGPLKRRTMHYRLALLKIMEEIPPKDESEGEQNDSGTGTPIADQVPEPLKGIQQRKPHSDSGIQKSTSEEKPSEENGQSYNVHNQVDLSNDRDERHQVDGSADFASRASGEASASSIAAARPPESDARSSRPSAPEPVSAWAPETVLAVYERRRDLLGVPALDESKRQKFLKEFESLRTERQVDAPTLRAVLRQMLLRAHVPLSPLFAHKDALSKPIEHPPMSIDALSEWYHDYRSGSDGSKTNDYFDVDGWNLCYDMYQGPGADKNGTPWKKVVASRDQLPAWIRKKSREMKESPWFYDDNLIPGQRMVW